MLYRVQFESNVKLYVIQTISAHTGYMPEFESNVKLYVIQTYRARDA